jgi:hypothetical protein
MGTDHNRARDRDSTKGDNMKVHYLLDGEQDSTTDHDFEPTGWIR